MVAMWVVETWVLARCVSCCGGVASVGGGSGAAGNVGGGVLGGGVLGGGGGRFGGCSGAGLGMP